MMTEDERAMLNALPDPVTAWRGTVRVGGDHQMSWTLDEARANRFAERFPFRGPGIVLRAEIPKEAVVAYFDGRTEREIVVVDPRRIVITGTRIAGRRSPVTGETIEEVST